MNLGILTKLFAKKKQSQGAPNIQASALSFDLLYQLSYMSVIANAGVPRAQIFEHSADGSKDVDSRIRPCIQISVYDTGIGIAPEDHERIFNAFEQVEGSKISQYKGTGLGLSLTRKLVELHGGKIWVESDGLGKGSTFRFVIPFS